MGCLAHEWPAVIICSITVCPRCNAPDYNMDSVMTWSIVAPKMLATRGFELLLHVPL